MSEPLHGAIERVPEPEWKPYGDPHPTEIRDCAEVPFVPSEKSEKKDTQRLRYVAIRIRLKQGALFEDGSRVRHFAVLSNRWELKPARLFEWHREKAATIEMVHDVVKPQGGPQSVLNFASSFSIHDALDRDTPEPRPVERRKAAQGRVVAVPRVGGLHHRYTWKAAP
jgi:hypothetical protein